MLSICTIAKNEARYLAEWIEYHLLIGVERIVIYDNGSEDDIGAVCAPYRQVELIAWPTRIEQQKRAYQDYLSRHAASADWTAFIDADEFICYRGPGDLSAYLDTVAQDVGGLELPWVIFGCNGHARRPPGLVLENYTRAHRVAPQQNVKTICRPVHVRAGAIATPHRFPYQPPAQARITPVGELCIFHYMLRSREDVAAKVARGDAWSKDTERWRLADMNAAIHAILAKYDGGDMEERHMLRHVGELKRRLARHDSRPHPQR